MLIKTTDFTLGAYIPNRDDAPNSDIIGNEPILQGFIDEEVKAILVRLLGYTLYAELKTQIDINGDLNTGVDAKWKNLVNGADAYQGLKGLLVAWVFAKFLESENDDYSTQGVNQVTSDGSNRVRPNRKIMLQYRKFYDGAVGDFGSGPRIIRNAQGTGIIYGYSNGVSRSGFMSLFQFLSENTADYPNWEPAYTPNQMNHYDI
jgi:hypothetical protein